MEAFSVLLALCAGNSPVTGAQYEDMTGNDVRLFFIMGIPIPGKTVFVMDLYLPWGVVGGVVGVVVGAVVGGEVGGLVFASTAVKFAWKPFFVTE